MNEQKLLGGTDGFRGQADLDNPHMGFQNETTHYWLTSALVGMRKEAGYDGPVVLARDTRPSGHRLAQASARAIQDQGLEVAYLDVAPTPMAQKVAELTGAMATVVVTASHNPAADNGWKGMIGSYKPNGEEVQTISDRAWELYRSDRTKRPDMALGSPYVDLREHSLKRMYADELVSRTEQVFGQQPLAGKIVVYDGANGAGSHVVPQVFVRLGAEVRMVNCGEGVINENCGAAQEGLTSLKNAIRQGDFLSNPNFLGGIANDGDADRLMMVGVVEQDGGKELVEINGNHMLYALAQGEPGIVGTIYTNSGLRKKLQDEHIAFDECGNGDKYVTDALKQRKNAGWRRGGEFTGHIVDMDWLNSGDGGGVGVWLAALASQRGETFGDLYRQVPLWTEAMQKVTLPSDVELDKNDPLFNEAQAWAVDQMAGEGRSIVRASGTEPVVRAWVESPHREFPQRIAAMLRTRLYRELVA